MTEVLRVIQIVSQHFQFKSMLVSTIESLTQKPLVAFREWLSYF